MNVVLKTKSVTTTGTLSFENRFLAVNTGGSAATVAGRSVAAGASFEWSSPGNTIDVAYVATGTTLVFHYEDRKQ